ncbi:uncharacterized protein NECHADRAFT_43320 [Fusarium vanettenii 77-13-4]|uniref:Uncharacterized protein n=1 Tax=Fusarium vanettenii (strain ATCC MYA-4622 / CBS 123669 / FGSC 9596 / NRRL 45880 / 77-13-4) TaxID=660122 RepID=C7Z9G4_FUSV7|nr:uncharacterized protein NECHADRAFT_43320 [Fusarium vanettenii 77-13-4]EEU39091.1 hypothetical protein NECHADRAFT_43320 [Fusarium vanettenii 77-13-4]
MERQDPNTPCTPPAVIRETDSRSTRPSLSSSPSAFTLTQAHQRRSTTPISSRPPTPASNTSTPAAPGRSPLWTSEPTLRFPRPQGSRHLANWISSSNPDIMRVTTTSEDIGLSESTYELISGTDTESQDGNYTGSISESVGSLDFHRPDDVHSFAGTEQTNDDESLADEYEPLSQPSQQGSEEGPDTTTAAQTSPQEQSWATVVKNGAHPEVEQEPEPQHQPEPEVNAESESESEDEALSRTSLDYTQQSLKAPSIPTPDASNIMEPPSPDDIEEDADTKRARFHTWLSGVQATEARPWQSNIQPNNWRFPGPKPDVTVTRHRGNFLIHVAQDVKDSWLSRKCLLFTAQRGEENVRFSVSSVDEGLLLKFPNEEAHGTVKVDIRTTCWPRIGKTLRITFEKGIISEALELSKAFAQNLPELVPAAAQEAERRLEGAKRSLETATDNFIMTSDSLLKTFTARFHETHRSLGWIKKDIRDRVRLAKEDVSKRLEDVADQVKQHLPNTDVVQQQARLGLLDAQISAKLWWLKLTAGNDEHTRYQLKAKEFMARKLAEIKNRRKLAHETTKQKAYEPLWAKMLGGTR